MTERPKKKRINDFHKCIMCVSCCACNEKVVIHNQACDDWGKYHKQEMSKLRKELKKVFDYVPKHDGD